MFSVAVVHHIMIAHSLPHEAFGPAQQLHGATYVVHAEFFSKLLTSASIVIDIGLASAALESVCKELNCQNLDTLPQFKSQITSTEFLAKYIHDRLLEEVKSHFSGRLKITLHESHVAYATYTED